MSPGLSADSMEKSTAALSPQCSKLCHEITASNLGPKMAIAEAKDAGVVMMSSSAK